MASVFLLRAAKTINQSAALMAVVKIVLIQSLSFNHKLTVLTCSS